MGFYGNINKVDSLNEAFFDKESVEMIKKRKTSNEVNRIKKFKSTSLTDEEYNEMKECIEIMTTEEKFAEYKKAFTKFAKFVIYFRLE